MKELILNSTSRSLVLYQKGSAVNPKVTCLEYKMVSKFLQGIRKKDRPNQLEPQQLCRGLSSCKRKRSLTSLVNLDKYLKYFSLRGPFILDTYKMTNDYATLAQSGYCSYLQRMEQGLLLKITKERCFSKTGELKESTNKIMRVNGDRD